MDRELQHTLTETPMLAVFKRASDMARMVFIPTHLKALRRSKTPTRANGRTTLSMESANRFTLALVSTTVTGKMASATEKAS